MVENVLRSLSVVVPVFNREKTIERALSSVLNQIRSRDEVIVVDDGSTDASKSIVGAMLNDDTRIRLITNSRRAGAPGARNTGLYRAEGDWVAFLDSDDEWRDGFFRSMFTAIELNPRVDIFTCHSQIVSQDDPNKTLIIGGFTHCPKGSITKDLLAGRTYVDTNAAVIRKQKLLDVGGWDERCPSFQEWDLHIRLSEFCEYECVPEFLVNYYQHDSQMSRNEIKTVDGLLFNLRKHKSKWRDLQEGDSWVRKCRDLQDRIDSLETERFKRFVDACVIEPRVLFYRLKKLPKRFVSRSISRKTKA